VVVFFVVELIHKIQQRQAAEKFQIK